MIKLNLQFFGGRGASGGRGGNSNAGGVSSTQLNNAAQDYLTHNVTSGTQNASLDKATIISDIDENGYANVKMDYTVRVRVATDYDVETGQMLYDTETEYKSDTFRIKVRK